MPFDRSMLILLMFSTLGCVATQSNRPVRVAHGAVETHPFQDVALAPPPPVTAPLPPLVPAGPAGLVAPTDPRQVWVDGHFHLVDHGYVSEPGHRAVPPRLGLHWQQPTWHEGQWFLGYWAGASPMPSVHARRGPWALGSNARAWQLGVPALQSVATAIPNAIAHPTGAQTVVIP